MTGGIVPVMGDFTYYSDLLILTEYEYILRILLLVVCDFKELVVSVDCPMGPFGRSTKSTDKTNIKPKAQYFNP